MKHLTLLGLLVVVASASPVYGGDGTLPVRLPGDGTLPTLVGDARDLANNTATTPARVVFTQLETEGIPGGTTAFTCRDTGPAVSQHQARGTLVIGDSSFAIKGVCYNEATSDMEIIAARPQNTASLISHILPSSQLSRLVGRLTVQPNQAGGRPSRFAVDLKDPNRPPHE